MSKDKHQHDNIMATEDLFTDRLSDYLDGEELSATERAAIEAHLATCGACRTTLAELEAVAARGRVADRCRSGGRSVGGSGRAPHAAE